MVRKFSTVLSSLVVLSIVASACSILQPDAPSAPSAGGGGRLVCLVTDTQGLDDKSFNATAWKGVEDAGTQLGIDGVFLESIDDTYYDVNLSTFVQGGCELIVSVGFLLGGASASAAETNPDQLFAIVDFDFLDFSTDPPTDVTYDNVRELTFQTDESAFMAGYVAASVTKTGKVGTFGGVAIPTVTIFMDGFALGVEYYNQQKGTDVQVLGWDPILRIGQFTDTFDDVQKGAQIGEALIAEGVDIIMPVAGGVGLGAAAIAKERGGVYLIGVDTDWTVSSPEFADIMLTSVLKNMDVAVLDTVRTVLDGTFQGGLYVGTLANDGIGLAPFHGLDSMVSAEVKADLERIEADIIAGTVLVAP